MKYYLLTLGCQMNLSDSERVNTVLSELGLEATDNEEEASVLGVIACSVRQKAIDKVYSRIHKWNIWKNQRPILTFVSGCMLPADREKFMKLFDIVFPIDELPQFPEMIYQYGIVTPLGLQSSSNYNNEEHNINAFWNVTPRYDSTFEAFIPIQNGCDKFCTFCAVPYTRGREVSRPSAEILSEVEKLVHHNYKSITILGQNVNSYGLDKKGKEITFAQLLEKIGEIGIQSGKEFWVYFTSPHPRDMGNDVIDTIARYPVLAKQIHLPLQSGDDKVLIHMNRKYNLDEYRNRVNYIREKIPHATLFTDIIVGFSGETTEQFENTKKAFHEFRFNMAFISQYSSRPGTVSSRWTDDIPYAEKKSRLHELTEVLKIHSYAYNQKLKGKIMKVLVTGFDRKGEYLSGLTEGKINVRIESRDKNLTGNFIDIKISEVSGFSVSGKPLPMVLEKTPQFSTIKSE